MKLYTPSIILKRQSVADASLLIEDNFTGIVNHRPLIKPLHGVANQSHLSLFSLFRVKVIAFALLSNLVVHYNRLCSQNVASTIWNVKINVKNRKKITRVRARFILNKGMRSLFSCASINTFFNLYVSCQNSERAVAGCVRTLFLFHIETTEFHDFTFENKNKKEDCLAPGVLSDLMPAQALVSLLLYILKKDPPNGNILSL